MRRHDTFGQANRARHQNLPIKPKKRIIPECPKPSAVPEAMHATWSADFMADALWAGRRFRTFNVSDDFNRESLRIEIYTSLPSQRVIFRGAFG